MTDTNTNYSYTHAAVYAAVRAAFVNNRTSLEAWALANHIAPQNVRKALRRVWRGPGATATVRRVIEAAGPAVVLSMLPGDLALAGLDDLIERFYSGGRPLGRPRQPRKEEFGHERRRTEREISAGEP